MDPKREPLDALPFDRTDLGNGTELTAAMGPDGVTSYWIVVPGGDDDQGCTDCASHERLGPLPDEWRRRIERNDLDP
jgi:hypothetical protein